MAPCSSCGSAVDDGDRFCPECGAYVAWDAEQAAPRTTGPPVDAPKPSASPYRPEPPRTSPARSATDRTDQSDRAGPADGSAAVRTVRDAVAWTDAGRRLADAGQRTDLVEHLDQVRGRLSDHAFPVAVVGEFKRGKSTLVNAVLQTSVCPVDADIVTAVPTLVRYGPEPGATAYREPETPGEDPVPEPVPLEQLADLVSEAGNPENSRRLRSVEVRLRHRLLRSGLCLVDTPGVGGLHSGHGVLTLGALDHAEGAIFVTDASQELSGPELDFLRQVVRRCPTTACVVTKTDLHAEWRRIADLDREHLRRAGLDLPVLPVSSFLRLRAVREPELLEESGFQELAAFLAGAVLGRAGDRVASEAAREVSFVTEQLAAAVRVERQVIADPTATATVTAGLAAVERQSARLTAPTATWQQALSDGVQDLVADVEHDLQRRLRDITREAEALVDRSDPQTSWSETSAWLHREVARAVVATHDDMARRTEDLAEEVAQQFDLEAEQAFRSSVPALGSRLDTVELMDGAGFRTPGGRLQTYVAAARTATLPQMIVVAIGVPYSALLLPLAAVATALGVGIGGKVIRDERRRQTTFRQQQAKVAVRRYIDEVGFVVGKDCRDGLRRNQRLLRDEFQARATVLHASAVQSMRSVSRAADLAPDERTRRAAELAAQEKELTDLHGRLEQTVAARPGLVAARE